MRCMFSAPSAERQERDYSKTAVIGEASAVAGGQWMCCRWKPLNSTQMRSRS